MILRKSTAVIFLLLFAALHANGQTLQHKSSKPLSIGITEELYSAILSETRTINIYLPEGYAGDDTTKYAVIYLLDGGMDEDLLHVAGLVQFNNFPWIARIPKSIVVGIANTDRKRDLTYPTRIAKDKAQYPTTGSSAKFIAFLEQELQPYIEKHYKVSRSRTLIGESLGGLLATEILFKKPELFNKYIIISPSLWWDSASLLDMQPAILNTGYNKRTDIYIGVGKEGLTSGEPPRVMEVDANMLADKIKAGKNKKVKVYFDYLPQEDHATIGHQAIFNAFRMLYPAKSKQ